VVASRDIKHLCPEMRALWFAFEKEAKILGHDILLICTWRNSIEQEALYLAKKSKRRVGPHNFVVNGKPASKACDFVLLHDGKICWDTTVDFDHDEMADYKELGLLAEKLGLEWGGKYKFTYDAGHIQLIGG
jgi:peptidoglycan L-alanyl-D-glutamate endopeptidase CwlK